MLRYLRSSPQAGLLAADIVLWFAFAFLAPGFMSSFNLFALGRDIAIFTVIGLAQMVVLSMGAMNLAVGAIGGVAAMLVGYAMQELGLPPPIAVVLALAGATILGWLNGWICVRTGMNSFIVTLAMGSIDTGLMIVITRAQAFGNLPAAFTGFAQAGIGPVSSLVIVAFVTVGVLALIYGNTELGRRLLAVGANPRAAELSAVPVAQVIAVGHALSGLLAGLAGVLTAARLASALPSIGIDWVLPSFLAPVLGGTLLAGGFASAWGTLLGGVLVVSIANGLDLMQVNGFWIQFFRGIVLLLAVGLDRVRLVAAERRGAALARRASTGAGAVAPT